MNQSVNRLVRRGHSLEAIGGYTLNQFVMFLDADRQLQAQERMDFVADMTSVVGSLFSDGKKKAPVAEHMEDLSDAAAGVKHG